MDKPVRAFIFDWGGVLLNQTWKGQMAYAAKALGVDPERLDAECHGNAARLFIEGGISENKFWQQVCGALDIDPPKQESLWYEALHSVAEHQQDVWDIAFAVRERGFRIGLLSNLDMSALRWLEDHGATWPFHARMYSCHEGIQKPNWRIYRRLLTLLDVEPHEAVMIDDKPDNVHGAKYAGLHGIHFQSTEQLKQELLNTYGISV